MSGNGDKPEVEAPWDAVIMIQATPDGRWYVSFTHCDLHQTLGILEAARQGLAAMHRQEHDKQGDWVTANPEVT